jgi:hypothetical protein
VLAPERVNRWFRWRALRASTPDTCYASSGLRVGAPLLTLLTRPPACRPADVVAPLLRPGGRLLLREFHPVSTKLISSKGKKHKVPRGRNALDLMLRCLSLSVAEGAAGGRAGQGG